VALTYKMRKKSNCITFFRITRLWYDFPCKNMFSAPDLRCVWADVCAEILNNLNSTRNILKKPIIQNFMPMKY